MSGWQEAAEEKKPGSIGFFPVAALLGALQSVERLPIARAAISFTPAGTDLAVGDLESGFKVVGSCGLNQELWSQPGTLAAGSWRIVNRPKLSPTSSSSNPSRDKKPAR